jgi:hypothetical protein
MEVVHQKVKVLEVIQEVEVEQELAEVVQIVLVEEVLLEDSNK